jgi:hypothetical protein
MCQRIDRSRKSRRVENDPRESIGNISTLRRREPPLHRSGRAEAPVRAAVAAALWQRLLGRPASESGRLCHRDGGHEEGDRYRRGPNGGYPP